MIGGLATVLWWPNNAKKVQKKNEKRRKDANKCG